jgi:peroxidase
MKTHTTLHLCAARLLAFWALTGPVYLLAEERSMDSTGAGPIPRLDPGPQSASTVANPRPRPDRAPAATVIPGRPLPPRLPESLVLPEEFRSADGSGNNVANTAWGTPGLPFKRLLAPAYVDGVSEPPEAGLPSARVVSNAVAAQVRSRPNQRGASDMLWQWGQFLDHDLTETLAANPAEAFPIAIPEGDASFDPTGLGTVTMGLNRSAYEMVEGVRQQKNGLTAWIDASQLYGSDNARTLGLRALDGTGRMKVSESAHGDLLPLNTEGLANFPPGPAFFVAGDVRVNEQIGLIAMQTLFVREHNYWADLYRAANSNANSGTKAEPGDEEIFQFARMIVAAEIQAITYREFLPLVIGRSAMRPYRGYKPAVDPTISNEFATAAYRFGHSLLSPTVLRVDARGREIAAGHLSLAEAFFQPQHITAEGIDVVLRGLCFQRCQELDEWVTDEVRNFLFGAPGAGGLDLASLNVQRGRDHGLPSLAAAREGLGLRPVRRFQDVNPMPGVARAFDTAYDDANQIDLWIGGLAEADRPGAMVGPVFQRILVDQFTRLRDGDRFWYQHYLAKDLVQMVEAQTLSVILRRNTRLGAEIPPNVFLAPKPNEPRPAGGGPVER